MALSLLVTFVITHGLGVVVARGIGGMGEMRRIGGSKPPVEDSPRRWTLDPHAALSDPFAEDRVKVHVITTTGAVGDRGEGGFRVARLCFDLRFDNKVDTATGRRLHGSADRVHIWLIHTTFTMVDVGSGYI